MCADAGKFYLIMPMECKEYMWVPANLILGEIMDKYNLHQMVHKDQVYAEILLGMNSLPQVC